MTLNEKKNADTYCKEYAIIKVYTCSCSARGKAQTDYQASTMTCRGGDLFSAFSEIVSRERLVHRYITTFKYIHGLADHNFNILRNSDIHSYNNRRRNDFTESRDFYINALRRNGTSLLLFKQNIKSYIF